jgi:glutamate-1-semialdehyde 2,1-aminomutase
VMCGFRVHPGGAQALYGVTPDLTTLGKVIGGGLPVGAYGGRREIMELIAPSGPVYQAGTLSGNPLAMTAGIATLMELGRPGVWDRVAAATADLAGRIERSAAGAGVPVRVQRVGTMLTVFFAEQPIRDWESARRADTVRFGRVFRRLLDCGVYWVPSQFESAFLSTSHGDKELALTGEAFDAAFRDEAGSVA